MAGEHMKGPLEPVLDLDSAEKDIMLICFPSLTLFTHCALSSNLLKGAVCSILTGHIGFK